MSSVNQLWPEDVFQSYLSGVKKTVREILLTAPSCHDWDHTLRVYKMAHQIAVCEKANSQIVDLAALLHDIGRVQELADRGKTCHALLGAAMVPELLENAGVHDKNIIAQIAACVRTHRFRKRGLEEPATLEAQVLFDADKLDSLGAIGLARSFHFAGHVGARVHNTEAEALASESYSREDTAYREYLVKLRYIPSRMFTVTGREFAQKRLVYMIDFFKELESEISL